MINNYTRMNNSWIKHKIRTSWEVPADKLHKYKPPETLQKTESLEGWKNLSRKSANQKQSPKGKQTWLTAHRPRQREVRQEVKPQYPPLHKSPHDPTLLLEESVYLNLKVREETHSTHPTTSVGGRRREKRQTQLIPPPTQGRHSPPKREREESEKETPTFHFPHPP